MRHGKPDAVGANATKGTLLSPLTKREQEVLGLMAFGLANKEIARRLSLSPRTVETHIDHVLGKLNAPTRARAVIEAGRAGLLGGVTTNGVTPSEQGPPNNLPSQLTTLLGREQDLLDAKSVIEAHRLVTFSGSGGVGKTRLALRLGVELLEFYPDGVWLGDFSPITDPVLVSSALARVLEIRERQNRPLVNSIVEALKRKRALLLFDNCEHVLDAAAELVDEILHKCPDVRILATSRQPLGIVGEVVYRVRSLSFPDSSERVKADAGSQYGAIALFIDRAQGSDTSFMLTDENAPIVAEICSRLDGIPLAIELAATRSNVINLQTLARSLDDRFKVLTSGGRTALPRHKTLTALIDWSYDLLTTQEQAVFTRLGIFAGGFSLAAAAAVCGGDDVTGNAILNVLASLADKSLVTADTRGEHERFRMLESTRAYALEKLAARNELDQLARRHAEYYRDQTQTDDKSHGTSSTFACLDNAELDLDNFRAALEWGIHQGNDAVVGASIAGALVPLWYRGGLSVEGTDWVEAALQRLDSAGNTQIAARLWQTLAELSSSRRAFETAEKAIRLFESAGDGPRAALALNCVVKGLRHMGRLDEARENSLKALAAHRMYGDQSGAANCLNQQALIASALGEIAYGRDLLAQALAIYKELGDELGVAAALVSLAELEFADGHPEEALRSGNEALEIFSGRRAHAVSMSIGHHNNTVYRIAIGDIDGARASSREGLSFARRVHSELIVVASLQNLALLKALSGQPQSAAKILGYVEKQFKTLGYAREPTEIWGYEKLMAMLRGSVTDTEIDRLAAEGAAWAEDQAIEAALSI